ncbi:MAG: phytase [Hyphomicrobium sp.]
MKIQHGLLLAVLAGVAASSNAAAQSIGPSTTTEPYLLPSRSGVSTKSILTTGDSIGGYRMVGIPDGMGAFSTTAFGQPANFDLVMHHELGATSGVVRSHGSRGAFVSRWTIERSTQRVVSGRDMITSASTLRLWNGSAYAAGTTAFDRFCSADMAPASAYNYNNTLGTPQRIFLSGEETSPPFANDHGRAFANIATGPNAGTTYQLPRLGRVAYENTLASPFSQAKTVVMTSDDADRETGVTSNICTTAGQTGCNAPPSELHMYVGTKLSTGTEVERAGLTNGNLYGIRVRVNDAVVPFENPNNVFSTSAPAVTSGRFEAVNLGDVSNRTGNQLQLDDVANQITQFIRIEDGAWDPRAGKQNDYYFVTTGRLTTSSSTWRASRLWRLRFDDITNPTAGGTIELLLQNQFFTGAGSTPNDDPTYQMFDNLSIDSLGRIILQEDVGGNDRLGRVYVYGIDSRNLVEIARHNAKFFGGNAATNPNFLTNDEESSGVIDASSFLGAGWFLLTVQNHRPSADTTLVEGGQLIAMFVDPSIK